ncbi:MAG: class I SAM-dependent methyltransferase [Methanoregula sp.]|nr:class I SAM-dependent methyltransferase [Methanoregula sp.]
MSADTTRDNWDADYSRKGSLYGGAPHQLPPFPAGSRVLEAGCGNGKLLSAMVHRDWCVTAIDFSPRAALMARATAREGSGAGVVVADARTIPFRDGSFDGVAANHILAHGMAADRSRIARELCRVLRPGGQLWFCDFSTRDFRNGAGHEAEPGTFVRGNGILTHYFSDNEVAGLFLGLDTVSVQRHDWILRVRGKEYIRSEITALFRKPPVTP